MEWYIRKGIPLNLDHFLIRAKDNGEWKKDTITEAEYRELLAVKIDTVKMNYVINDIKRFITELATTVFACYLELKKKNALITQHTLFDVFYNWAESKKRFSNKEIVSSFEWLRQNGLITNAEI